MLNADGRIYLPYSGKVPRDSPQALLLKRVWESLRRNGEFLNDYQVDQVLRLEVPRSDKQRVEQKWGVAWPAANKSFQEIVGQEESIVLDDPNCFNDMYLRLYGDSFYGEDRVVQCHEFQRLCDSLSQNDRNRLIAIARGEEAVTLGALSEGAPHESTIHLTIDVDQNPIATLYKVQIILRSLRQARVAAGSATPLDARIEQQLATFSKKLDADIVGDGRRAFRLDDDVFKVWDLSHVGKSHDEIAREVWPAQHRRDRGVRNVIRDRTAIGAKVRRYKQQAEAWIEIFSGLIKR